MAFRDWFLSSSPNKNFKDGQFYGEKCPICGNPVPVTDPMWFSYTMSVGFDYQGSKTHGGCPFQAKTILDALIMGEDDASSD